MVKKVKDHYFYQAKKKQFPARSVFKLQQIDQRYKLIKEGMKICEIGAAPGSWTKWLATKIGPRGKIYAIDKDPLKINITEQIKFIKSDLFKFDFTKQFRDVIPFDALLSDVAPSTSGIKSVDQENAYIMAEYLLDTAKYVLKEKGFILLKIFQGPKTKMLISQMKKNFKSVSSQKPPSSRAESFEIFLLGTGFIKSNY